jgi:tail lysozyme
MRATGAARDSKGLIMSRNMSCVLLVIADLLCLATTACTPQLIVAPQVPAAVAPAAVAPPSTPASCRIDPDRRPASERIDDAAAAPAIDGDGASVALPDSAAPGVDDPALAPAADRERASDAPWDARARGSTGDGGVVLTLAASDAPNSAARTAFEFFVTQGLARVQAAGIVGNLLQESNVNPAAIQAGGPGRGIAQWSVGARWNGLLRFARAHHQSALALDTQLQFLWHELTTVPSLGLGALRAARSVAGATGAFARSFEVCGLCNEPRRVAFAEAVLRAFGNRAARRGG